MAPPDRATGSLENILQGIVESIGSYTHVIGCRTIPTAGRRGPLRELWVPEASSSWRIVSHTAPRPCCVSTLLLPSNVFLLVFPPTGSFSVLLTYPEGPVSGTLQQLFLQPLLPSPGVFHTQDVPFSESTLPTSDLTYPPHSP